MVIHINLGLSIHLDWLNPTASNVNVLDSFTSIYDWKRMETGVNKTSFGLLTLYINYQLANFLWNYCPRASIIHNKKWCLKIFLFSILENTNIFSFFEIVPGSYSWYDRIRLGFMELQPRGLTEKVPIWFLGQNVWKAFLGSLFQAPCSLSHPQPKSAL